MKNKCLKGFIAYDISSIISGIGRVPKSDVEFFLEDDVGFRFL